MEAVAKLKNLGMSPRKVRLVADLVRGENVNKALNTLKFTKKHAAKNIEKLLVSAISNWEQGNPGRRADDADLFIKTITVDGGRMLKRFRPAPFGRPHRIRKRSNHITLVVDSRLAGQTAQVEEVLKTTETVVDNTPTDNTAEQTGTQEQS